ncbi:MAG: glycosyltransferase family 4 protein [Candidatus Nanoarchaeia archaeon]
MEKIIGIRYGRVRAHPCNREWFAAVGVKMTYPFNIFTDPWVYKLGPLNQLFGFLYSLIIPRAETYLLTSTGCVSAVWLKKKLHGSKIIAVNSDTFYRDLRKARGLKRVYMNWLAKNVDGIVSTSHLMKGLVDLNVPHEVVYPYCDVKRFSSVKPDYKSGNICSIGTGVRTKGTDILYEVYAMYKKKFSSSKLFVLGEKRMIAHMKHPEGTVLPGKVDPRSYLSKSSIYINTSRHESFGVNIVEAMCAGFVPLVTDRCGAAELVREVDPSLVTSLDSSEIAKKAVALQRNSAKRKKLGAKAKKVARRCTKGWSVRNFKNAFSLVSS